MSDSRTKREHGHAPDHEHRPEVLDGRKRHPQHPPRAEHHHLASVTQVAGQEDDQADLGELRGLKAQSAGHLDLEVGAVDLLPDPGQARQHEQHQGHHHDHIAVLLELAVVAEGDDRHREQHEPQHEPLGLLARVGGTDPVDHHDPEAGQERHQGEHVGVGVGQRDADEDVPDQAQAQEDRPVGERHVGQHLLALDEHAGESSGDEQGGRDQAEQLTVARAHRASWPSSAACTRPIAFPCERNWWLSSRARRSAGTALAGTPET